MTQQSVASDYVWIGNDQELQDLCSDLRQQLEAGRLKTAFIDTEADSLHHFQEKLCLIQLAAGGRFALIDSLAIAYMTPLLAILEQTDLWLHGADYDLTLLKRTYGWIPPQFHDTQIAARLTGHRAFGLAALVEHHCQVSLCKSSQKADWSQRPLPQKMQVYAVDDVRYLERLSNILTQQLSTLGRLSWFEESCESLRQDVLMRQERGREDAWRISGSGKFRGKGLALLKTLWHWRDSMARERDVPPFRILNNQQLLAMAGDYEANGTVMIPQRWRGKWRETFEDALQQLAQSDPVSWPQRLKTQHRRVTEEDRDRIDRLCKARDVKAEQFGIESSLLGSRSVMEEIVLRSEDGLSRLMPWQKEAMDHILSQP